MKKRYTVTAALPYANGPLHIGHLAGAYLPADTFVRYLKEKGRDVAFICGSDEHGAAITLRAKKEGVSPQQIIDQYHSINKKAFEDFGIDFSEFHRTSDPLHHETAQGFFTKLLEKGSLTTKTSEQFYDEEYEQFLADRYVTGQCPKCSFENAYGDQCENCGSSLSPDQLIHPISTLSGKTPVMRSTKHWYLPMGEHEQWLKDWIVNGTYEGVQHHDASQWRNTVVGQCKSWLDGGLHDRAMTRDLDWGVKVPLPDVEGKVLYVWLDAPIGYISATKAWAAREGKDWRTYWQDEETELIHFIGKDNIVFHCIIFPIILKAHGSYNLPTNVPANEFLNLEGAKISTSRNWAVWLHEYLEDFPNRKDELRYVLTSIAPETKDSEFTWSDYQARVNNELVAILGNFVNRALVLTNKYYKGTVPSYESNGLDESFVFPVDGLKRAIRNVEKDIEQYRFKDALTNAMRIARMGNKFLADTEPWKLSKQGMDNEVAAILHQSVQVCAALSGVLRPFLPTTAEKLTNMIGLKAPVAWDDISNLSFLEAGHQLGEVGLLFTKVEDEEVAKQVEKLNQAKVDNAKEAPKVVEKKENIAFEDFLKLDIRVGTILEAKPVKKADKLLELLVDLGTEKRTIVSGIAQHYAPNEVVGKQVSVLCNLAPRKLRGVLSEGMILMAENDKGELSFISPEKAVNSGAEIS